MNDKFISCDDISRDMKQIEEMGAALAERFALLERNLSYMFSLIRECQNKQEVKGVFKCLDRIQIHILSQSLKNILIYTFLYS